MRRHPTRWSALLFGILFVAIITLRLSWQYEFLNDRLLDARGIGVIGATGLIILGLIGIGLTLLRDRQRRTNQPTDSQENHA